MNKHRTVHLRIYKGQQGLRGIAKDESGKVINHNHLVKLTHNTKEWSDYLKMMVTNGFLKVDVIGYCDGVNEDGSFIYSEVEESVITEVYKAMNGHKEVALTPEQKEIAELKAQMAELLKAKAPKKEKEPKKEVDSKLEDARKKHLEVFGEKAHHLLSIEKINEKLNNK